MQQYDAATGRLIHVLTMAQPCVMPGCVVYNGHPGEHEFTCAECDVALTAANEANDRDADFWLGVKRDRYCILCADRIAEAQYVNAIADRYRG